MSDPSMEASVNIAITGLRSLILINGGAVIASLALLGDKPENPIFLQAASIGVQWYVCGLCAAIFCIFCAFITQELNSQKHSLMRPMQVISAIIALLSLLCFAVGSFESLNALTLINIELTTDTETWASPCSP